MDNRYRPTDTYRIDVPPAGQQSQGMYNPESASYNTAGDRSQSLDQNQINPNMSNNQVTPMNLLNTQITVDDMTFVKNWKHDCFYKRTLPIEAIALGSFYYYNKTRNLPQSILRFTFVSFGAYFLSVLSYRGEFRRRLETTHLNTPFIQAWRKALNLTPKSSLSESGYDQTYSESFGDNYELSTEYVGGDQTSNMQPSMRPSDPYGRSKYDSGGFNYNPSGGVGQEQGGDQNRPDEGRMSYDELRARNRGLIR